MSATDFATRNVELGISSWGRCAVDTGRSKSLSTARNRLLARFRGGLPAPVR
jgi:hypothetical protein